MFQQIGNKKNFEAHVAHKARENSSDNRIRQSIENDNIDSKYGFNRVKDYLERTGYLINFHANEIVDEDKRLISVVDFYFIEDDGSRFKVSYPYQPYFYLLPEKECMQEVMAYISKKFAGSVLKVEPVLKEDLDLPNHLSGLKQRYLKVYFATMTEMIKVKQAIHPSIRRNREKRKNNSYYTDMLSESLDVKSGIGSTKKVSDHMENIIDIREHDVPYHVRVSIDLKIFVGHWYTVLNKGLKELPVISRRDDIMRRPDMIVLAFDIETTKLPLKFPDANIDQIMMISYMIDGQGFLIINREILSEDIDHFDYTPKPEYEGHFKVFNETNEAAVLTKFFDHIHAIKPHIFVTYNGDFFDWPFIETRATVHSFDMEKEIGFAKNKEGIYCSRPAVHMDCLCWVRRDSYLPVGSQNLKAVAKAKLRYDPIELDPEDMCRLAAEDPQVLSNYSVSDAVATYYLYMKYVHTFIYALCTIIPMEPDEILRKGSGTLCEVLLMVEAYHANIIFPNKQETIFNKMTEDGHVLEQETYIGGHVEAIESGVFRSDIPYRFRISPEAVDELSANVEQAITHAIEVEENIPLKEVINFEEVVSDIRSKLFDLKNTPNRLENPIIYHLDVGAMYPNIILTNRLQPSAVVDEMVCAACDYNRPGATCQRNMTWMWRGEVMPASKSEYQRIQQQLEIEKFPGKFPNDKPRAFHQLSREEQAAYEKKRLTEYSRKVYKKTHVTRIEERTTTVCQKENSFYVDTVRAFRDRRYEYKAMTKVSKKEVADAMAKGNANEIKAAKNKEIIYDSLQLAHKCILNSFYGYVMRKGSRWFSMEMGGIVCCTGSSIITKAREIVEKVGRPLELDTDGIWCMLPSSFPENVTIRTTLPKKSQVVISYPNAVLNSMVKQHYTNHVYHELVDKENFKYIQKSENSIFFEVDGPYLAMILPASKEEGKKLKKRYAVFNFDGSLAELKGFEVKRRGELRLIKLFQSSVFEAFLKGDTLEKCYQSVAMVADSWLDVLYSKAINLPDSELFNLISENRSMSRKLTDYGTQKSTSISTAKRLAEFLGDQMVKDAGLACKYIISRKPEGAPVTERAIPVAIFQTEPSVQRYYLRKWLKDNSLDEVDIRDILDWNYYIERLNGTIQKIITIPAALQGVSNPVPRVRHPDWLHKRILDKNDVMKQRKIDVMFKKSKTTPKSPPSASDNLCESENLSSVTDVTENPKPMTCETDNLPLNDIEDVGRMKPPNATGAIFARSKKRKRKDVNELTDQFDESGSAFTWRKMLGPPPPITRFEEWLTYQKKKWNLQAEDTNSDKFRISSTKNLHLTSRYSANAGVVDRNTLSGFLRRTKRTLLDSPWEILQVCETGQPGVLKVWAMVTGELHNLRLIVPKIFYVNQSLPREESEDAVWTKCNRILPRSTAMQHLYRFMVPEESYQGDYEQIITEFSTEDVEGIYETRVSCLQRTLMTLGCVCSVDRKEAKRLIASGLDELNTFSLQQLEMRTLPYLKEANNLKYIYLYCRRAPHGPKAIYGVFIPTLKKASVFAIDTVRTNQMPNMVSLYSTERAAKIMRGYKEADLPINNFEFEVRIETDTKQVYRQIQRKLQAYKDEKKGPTVLVIQSIIDIQTLISEIPDICDFPYMCLFMKEVSESVFTTLDWQRVAAKSIIKYYLNSIMSTNILLEQCRYLHLPVGNVPDDSILFGADIFYCRHLLKHNFVLWVSETEKPDLGGCELDDNGMLAEFGENSRIIVNNDGCYSSYCMELEIDGLAVTTLLQSHHIQDIEGTNWSVSFDTMPQASLEEMMEGAATTLTSYDEVALCSAAFKVLRSMVNVWLRDVSIRRNTYADDLISQLYRWIRSPRALLYDPALHRTLYNLMKKLFMQLVAEFKRLGSVIIFANFNKIIICTKKRTLEEAVCYVKFVVQSITNKELFHSLQISANRCWKYLMWLDSWNYAGIRDNITQDKMENASSAKEINPDRSNGSSSDAIDSEEESPEIEMNWNLMEFLPAECGIRQHFRDIIAGYLEAVYLHLSGDEDFRLKTQHPPQQTISQPSQAAALGVGANSNTASFAKELISGEISNKLFSITMKIHKKLPILKITEDTFKSPFIDLQVINNEMNPTLEFVKSVCKVLSLDKDIDHEVTKLRRNLLRLIGVKEFSDAADWKDPCLSWVLQEVICKGCNHCSDLDLCKDVNRVVINGITTWLCPNCGTAYNSSAIEFMLIDAFNRKTMAYVLQDLQCKKCSQIKMDNMSPYCSCSGSYKTLIPESEIKKDIRTFQVAAKYFKMKLLEETVEHLNG